MTISSVAAVIFRFFFFVLLFLFTGVAGATATEMPAPLGQLDVPAPAVSIAATPDGKRLVAQLQAVKDGPAKIAVIDAGDPGNPSLLTLIPIEKAGQLAISANGESLLFAVETEKRQSFRPTKHQLVAFDISQPSQPKQVWQQTIIARDISLAPDASAYAFAPSDDSSNRAIKVVWLDHQTDPVTLPIGQFDRTEEMYIAPQAAFLSYGNDPLIVDDLRHRPIIINKQTNSGMIGGWRNELVALLDTGYLLVRNLRSPQFGIHAPQDGVPRVGRTNYSSLPESEYFYFQAVAVSGSTALVRDGSGKLYLIDASQPNQPQLQRTWRLPRYIQASAIDAAGHLFAIQTREGKNTIGIYDLRKSVPAAVDWKALEASWAAALKIYANRKSNVRPSPDAAIAKFEEADPMLAVDAPVDGVSTGTAAAILNDYGFLLSKSWKAPRDDVAAALRRAIALDSNRALAYLNLADFLRSTLPGTTDWQKKEALTAEAISDYKKYLALGGQAPEVTSYVNSDAAVSASPDICTAIVNYANAGRLNELISTSANEVEVHDRKLDFIFGTEGTAHVPNVYAFDAADETPVDQTAYATPNLNDLWGGDELGLIVYRNEIHMLHYRDEAHPSESVALTGDKACGFSVTTAEQTSEKAAEPELCKAIHAEHGPTAIDFDEPVSMARDDVAKKYDETDASGMKKLDIGNDGHPVNVARLEQTSGAGAGCDAVFFDLVDTDGGHFVSSRETDLLMALQQADPSGRYPILPCQNQPKFFKYKGKVYFETKPTTWPPIDTWNQYHRVSRIVSGKVEEVCHFNFKMTVSQQ